MESASRRRVRLLGLGAVALAAAWAVGIAGRQRAEKPVSASLQGEGDPSAASAVGAARPQTADEILRRMIAAYRAASSYRDEGVFRAVLQRDGETTEDAAPLTVVWARPNRLAVRAYQAAVACNGQTLQAKIRDEASGDLDGQIVERPIGERLTLDDLFSDAVLRESLGGRLGLHPLQLELLLHEKPLQAFLDPAAEKLVLPVEEFDGRPCYRVKVELQGRYVFWIDQENFLLRRLEYPGDKLLSTEESVRASLAIVAEFHGAQFNAQGPAERFSLPALDVEIPEDAKKVRFFVIPPQPLPTQMFGRTPAAFEFAALDGGRVTPETLSGKIAVLAWFSNHPGSQACLQALDAVRRRMEAKKQIAFYAVCTEPTAVSNEDLSRLAAEWGVEMPVVRDLGAYGRDAFDIRLAPSLVVLDAKGAVQIHESGANPHLAALVKEQLIELLERLAEGEDFAAAILTQAQAEQEAYRLNLEAARVDGSAAPPALAPAEIAPESLPQRLRLAPLWETKELDEPGNLLVLEGAETRLLALDGGRAVAELDAGGKVVRRIELDLPEGAAVSSLRAAVDRAGRRLLAAFRLLGPQAHVFDPQGRRILSYPKEDQEHDGVRDLLLTALDDSGSPQLLVGFWGLAGVHGVDLSGQALWRNREMAPVLSLAATPKDVVGWRKALATGNAGHVLRLNQYGNADPPIHVPQRAIHQIVAAPWEAERPTVYLGLSYAADGNLTAIGLSAEFEERWSYRLPPGAHANPIQFATSCRLFDGPGGEWLLAGPDGSLHLISDDGEFFDYFQTGRRLTGIAAFRSAGQNILVAASELGVLAWSVERPR